MLTVGAQSLTFPKSFKTSHTVAIGLLIRVLAVTLYLPSNFGAFISLSYLANQSEFVIEGACYVRTEWIIYRQFKPVMVHNYTIEKDVFITNVSREIQGKMMENWDDERFVLALTRHGSIRAAARSLGVNHTTVSRRIAALEKQLSARLFELTSSGHVLTASGKIISDAAESVEALLQSSHRRIEGADTELSGDVYINIPDIFERLVCDHLAPFLIQHPKLNIHLTCDTAVADLAKREADIALRFTQTPPLDMVGRKVWQVDAAVYASSDFPYDPSKPLSEYPWIRWTQAYRQSPVELWAEKASVGAPSVTRVTTYNSISRLIEKGAGIGCLSPWFAKNTPNLKRITPTIEEASMDIWLLIHPDLRGVRRIDALKELLIRMFESKKI